MKRTNVEIKARCDDLEAVRARLDQMGVRYEGEDHQIDTYFHVPEGRLKLRTGTIERHLIFYRRPDRTGPKRSDVRLYAPGEAHGGVQALGALLTEALGVHGVVEKRRAIYFVENVKVHLDRVEGLGTFVEVEAIDTGGTCRPEALRRQCERMMAALGLRPDRLVAASYSDLLRGPPGR